MASPTSSSVRDPLAEAQAMGGADLDLRVLEPSPPAVVDPPYFADDPVEVERHSSDRPLVLPTGVAGADLDWGRWAAEHPDHATWVADRWLGGKRRLPAAPSTLPTTVRDLHRLAAYVIAPARHAANGKFGLRWTLGGFGTPFFGDDRQIRVDGNALVDQRGNTVRTTTITSLRAAAEFLHAGIDTDTAAEHDTPGADDIDAQLDVDVDASRFLGAWFGMAFAALEVVRSDAESEDATRPQIWPGHFDPAIEVGDEEHRASYGASPGDASIPEPYLYVSVWWPDRLGLGPTDDEWSAPSFVGRVLPLSALPVDEDPALAAALFWRRARDDLRGLPRP